MSAEAALLALLDATAENAAVRTQVLMNQRQVASERIALRGSGFALRSSSLVDAARC